ncbi:MAG: hypothetical protein J0I06_12040, partial [Planctomycetes bacterium]|nr:hypothetical protein [Planctomycetota bacterium]
MDGLTFGENGDVSAATSAAEMRELRYNWLWVLQRPNNSDRYTVRMRVVVFDRRVHLYAPPGSEAVVTTAAGFSPGNTAITNVPTTAEVRKGTWVMDAGNQGGGLRHAEFYRVVSVTEVPSGTNTTYTLEVHKPIVRADGQAGAYTGTLVVMPAVAEVFDRPMLTGGNGP